MKENKLQIFNNEEFGQIRAVVIDDKPYFAGKDVAEALGYKNTKDAIAAHVMDEDKRIIQRSEIATLENHIPKDALPVDFVDGNIPNRGLCFINESGIYALIFGSKLPTAKKFKRWVTSEVLPSIRKNGGYIAGQENMSDTELMAKALLVAQKQIEQRNAIIETQQKQIEADRPKTIFADAVSASKTSILVGDLAKLICQNGVQVGQKRLFAWLRENGYLIKRKGADWNMPTQKSMEQGLFEIKESIHVDGNGCNITTRTPKVTGKGQVYFVNKFVS